MRTILAVNAGSSSLKLSLFNANDPALPRIAHQRFENLNEHRGAVHGHILSWAKEHGGDSELIGAVHRVVHGGSEFGDPVVVCQDTLRGLEALIPLAPLHQPLCLDPVHAIARAMPTLAQVVCFDTAFHRGRASAMLRYGLPEVLWKEGIRRYGFHGLSYDYIVSVLPTLAPDLAPSRIVIAHLGAGASLCAVRDEVCVDTSMGFSALSGLVMATRCGELDAGAVLHLLRDGSRSVEDVEDLLYRRSGLLGLSGSSADVRDLLVSEDPAAREAIDCFVLRIVREIGAMVAMLGGLDAIVFTAGIGEHSSAIRSRIAQASAWAGLAIDEEANAASATQISTPTSKVSAWVIPTNEERRMAEYARDLLVPAAT